jgi:hypothetical protein
VTTPAGEFLLYQTEDGRTRVECRFIDDTLWLTQALMAELFQKDVRTINEHLKNAYEEGELEAGATIRKFRIVRQEGGRQVSRNLDHYNLDAILAVGYRIRSQRGTQFRRWATERLREYLIKGFTLDDERLKNPPVAGSGVSDRFDELLERIRDIRASERRMYLRVREIFSMAADYAPSLPETCRKTKPIPMRQLNTSASQPGDEHYWKQKGRKSRFGCWSRPPRHCREPRSDVGGVTGSYRQAEARQPLRPVAVKKHHRGVTQQSDGLAQILVTGPVFHDHDALLVFRAGGFEVQHLAARLIHIAPIQPFLAMGDGLDVLPTGIRVVHGKWKFNLMARDAGDVNLFQQARAGHGFQFLANQRVEAFFLAFWQPVVFGMADGDGGIEHRCDRIG